MRVLYVEDNPLDADLVRRALSREDAAMELEVAPTLAQARAALDAVPPFDVVLTDLNLPDGHGLELVAEIRRGRLPVALVALTGQGDEATVLAALKAGADDYLAKSDDFAAHVGATVRAALAAFRAGSARNLQTLRVLYAEPSVHDVDLTRRHFEAQAAHIRLECVADAAAALDRLSRGGEGSAGFDVLLLDFRLAGDSGLDVLKVVRQDRGLDLPVVMVTGQGNEDVAALAMRLGATDYVVKRSNYLLALPALLENAFHRVQAAREHSALRALNASLERIVADRTAELEAAKEAAEAANRSKSSFLARMSHDLRTPLNAVLGFSQLLAMDPTLQAAAAARRQIQLIHDAGRHLLAMIDEVLDLARIESGGLRLSLETVDACQLVQECLQLVGPLAAQHHVALERMPADGACLVRADKTRLRQVLVNLLTNGIKYNHAGGHVQVRLSDSRDDVTVTVIDDGRGMTAQQMAVLFEPFNRMGAEASGIEGTGLGLAIARQLVDAMQGRLEVRSVPGAGSTFTVTLPAAESGAEPAGSQPSAAVHPLLTQTATLRRVLYVEDNPVNQILMRELLRRQPSVELQVASDGPGALALAVQWRPQLVLLDLHLPGMSGLEVLQHLRADPTTAGIPCVAVSALALESEIQNALDQGCAAYLTKPFEVAELVELIERHTR